MLIASSLGDNTKLKKKKRPLQGNSSNEVSPFCEMHFPSKGKILATKKSGNFC